MISIFFELYFQGLIGNCFVRIRCFLNFIFKVWLGKFKICTPLGARVGGFFFSFSLHSVLRKRRKTTKPEWGVKKHTRQFASQHICCILIFVLYIHQVIYKEIHYLSFCAHSALQIYISEIQTEIPAQSLSCIFTLLPSPIFTQSHSQFFSTVTLSPDSLPHVFTLSPVSLHSLRVPFVRPSQNLQSKHRRMCLYILFGLLNYLHQPFCGILI